MVLSLLIGVRKKNPVDSITISYAELPQEARKEVTLCIKR